MQLIKPIYPVNTTLINAHLGVYELDGIVQSLVNGLPVYSHFRDDNASFRFITSNFIHQGLYRNVDIEQAFCVSEDTEQPVGRFVV